MTIRRLAFAAALALASTAHAQAPLAPVIEQGSLAELDAWAVGALARGEPALPRSLWAQSDPAGLALLMDRVPAAPGSPAGLRLARQALLSPAAAPPGDALTATRKRYETLARLGAADEIVAMVAGSGEAKRDPAIALYATQADLARGRLRDACRRADTVQPDAPPPFILRLRALCFAAAGEKEGADLALEVARTAGAGDPWFQSVVAMANGAAPARPPVARFDTSLNAAASTTAKLKPPAQNALVSASMFALAIVARSEDSAPPVRAQAAARALRQQILPADVARAAARAETGQRTPTPIAAAVAEVDAATSAYAQALAIETAMKRAKSHGEFVTYARLFQSDLTRLPLDPGTAPAAATFARAFIALGDPRAALAWRKLADSAPPNMAALSAVDLALAIARNDASLATYAAEQRINTVPANAAGLAARDLMALRALDLDAGPAAQGFLARVVAAPGRKPDPALTAPFAAAVQRGAAGEAALYASILLGDGAETLDAQALADILQGLRRVGLEDAARTVAVEAVIGGQAR